MFLASVTFVFSVWLVIHLANKNWLISSKIAIWLFGWYGIVFILGKKGFFGETTLWIPHIAFAFVVLYFFIKYLYYSPALQKIFDVVPQHWIIALQFSRIMGYGFLSFYFLGLLPGEFAIPTAVGDILVGFAAPIIAFLYYKKKTYARKIAMIWNYFGLADLAMALTLGPITYPKPFQILPTEIPSTLIALNPLVMIPLFAVPLSILLHLFSLRKLKTDYKS